MEWDQKLFHYFFHLFSRHKKPSAEVQARAARACHLDALHDRLTILARALTGASIQLHRAEAEGGLQGDIFFLPTSCDRFSSSEHNALFYLFRICFLAQQRRDQGRFRGPQTEPGTRRFTDAFVDAIIAGLKRSLPSAEALFKPLFAEASALEEDQPEEAELPLKALLFGRQIHGSSLEGEAYAGAPLEEAGREQQDQETPTTRQAPPKEEIESLQIQEEEIESYTLMHQFEKVETLDEFRGRWRDMDGDDDLDEHAEALEEVDLRHTVRSDVPAHSVYQADFIAHTSIPESEEAEVATPNLTYPEWDHKRRSYKPDHCKVFLRQYERQDQAYADTTLAEHKGLLLQLRRKLARLHNELEQRRRQRDGERLDLDSLIEAYADRAAGRTPDERIYLAARPRRRDIAVLILMDMSLSTDAYVDNRRILDVEKAAVLLFSQLLHEQGERFQIDAFCSRTRSHCHYVSLKPFGASWRHSMGTVAGLQPAGYTRIGPALRHATQQLAAQPARKKWILFLSDGKPNDYDRYEGQYGIQDVRQAIREAHQAHIHTYALAIDPQARHVLPQLFGQANYQIMAQPSILPEAMIYFYTRLLRS